MIVQEPVQAAIWHCLNHYAYRDAIFLAERLWAELDTEDALFLLATCYYRSGRVRQAHALLTKKAPSSSQCRFLLAKCCYDLEKYAEAEAAIIGGYYKQLKNLDEIVTQFGDQACFSLQIIAKIYYRMMRTAKGSEAHKLALKLNPFLWHSFEELCNVGEKVDPAKTFQLDKLDSFATCHGTTPILNYANEPDLITPVANNPATPIPNNITPAQNNVGNGINSGVKLFATSDESPAGFPSQILNCSAASPRGKMPRYRSMFSNSMSPLTPSFGILPLETNTPEQIGPPHATLSEANDQKSLAKRVSSLKAHVGQLMSRKETPLQQGKPVFSQSGNTSNTANIVTVTPTAPVPTPQALQGPNVRRSSRLFSNSYSVKENNKSPNRNKFAPPKSPSRKPKARLSKTNLNKANFNELNERNRNEKEKSETITSDRVISSTNTLNQNNMMHCALLVQKQCAEGLMTLLRVLGTAYQHLSQFNCSQAIELFSVLPAQHYNTGWVLSMLAKAHFEMIDYKKAASYFAQVRQLEPQRTEMMEIYSTVLWHLHAEVQLSTLAQELVSEDRYSPTAWCATGNLFSAQTEHETAIKFFQRAIQVDPNFPYAYTLLGHEYVMTEELDKAITAFRNAIRLDPRHYNAWFGLGTIFSKQEQYSLAELHFKRALQINPQNSAIMCHIGVVQHALKKTDLALKTLNQAIQNDPDNTLCKFHRASINFSTGRPAEALKEFEELKNIVPKESLVYYSIGKVHKQLGNTHLALMYFSWATDLDPKGVNSQIKEAILSPGQGDDDPTTQLAERQAQNSSTEQEGEASGEVDQSANVTIDPQIDDSDNSL
ncbi:cell division cycle protein 27 homolog [Neodiprion pinetum]|uniref:cell division cycle protein 27 homolog n=1 Tax=Neodiprion pinetum TaxID=441929 RepID=UPI001ED96AF0|nr:cell division cycle protein 27 homolog isoform X1 [Neodiprion fabricii]XP_046492383.1 cell division cycle protein 27 homolog isoform X1 [Neodiprion pinetum]XP_046628874.1 cell division cycle protein 27 homolog isoform X1 [Neodiprion virginianus]